MRHYSTANAVCSDQDENIFDDFDLSGGGEGTSYEEVCAALGIDPEPGALSQKVIETLSRGPKVLSKKVTARPRSSDRQDKLILRKIQLFQIPGTSPDDLPLVGAPHPSDSTSSSTHTITLNPPANDNRIPVWKFGDDLTDILDQRDRDYCIAWLRSR
jgi:hypothetical protein